MADVEYDSGDQWHDGGIVIDFDDGEDLTFDELEEALYEWMMDEDVLIDFEGEEDFYS